MKKYFLYILISLTVVPLIFWAFLGSNFISYKQNHMLLGHQDRMDENMRDAEYNEKDSASREEFIKQKNAIVSSMLNNGNYTCCLAKPCTYCIEESAHHGEGASCTCLEDVVNGKHPCGECIGEILEGHGNKYLSEYFAPAIADEVGQEHMATLTEIIKDKYGTSSNDQTETCNTEENICVQPDLE